MTASDASGHVYVIAFDNGTVKVGRSQDMEVRLRTHEQTARGFGLSVTGTWSSPQHDGWIKNESALKDLAGELGGIPRSDEWFAGVDFSELVTRAAALKFPVPRPEERPISSPSGPVRLPAERRARKTPAWLAEAVSRLATTGIPLEGIPVERAVEMLRNRILADRSLMRALADDYARSRLRSDLVMARRAAAETRRRAA